jgi:ATPase subunit of ABC transporter with duplicated ATPase domains
MSFITFDNVSCATPDGRVLFEHLTLSIGAERVGLVGRNGSGKSTLLRLIASGGEPASGAVNSSGRIGVLQQAWPDDGVTLDEALGVRAGLALLAKLERGEGSAEDAGLADWTLEQRIDAALVEVGLAGFALDRVLGSLSGGERTRLALAKLLLEQPDVLLLDEPTNNLDAAGRQAIVEMLARWRGGAIVASHDRVLLENVDRIVELSSTGVTVFGGGWSAFAEQREARRAAAEAAVEKAEGGMRRATEAVQEARERQAKRDKAGRAKRAKGDAPKMLLDAMQQRAEATAAKGSRLAERVMGEANEALDQARKQLEVLTPLSVDAPSSGLPLQRVVLMFEDVAMAHGERKLFGSLSLKVIGPERIRIAGPNGSGKTTLLNLIAGKGEPTSGTIRRLDGRIAMLDQHVDALEDGETLLANMRRLNPELNDNAAHAALARFAFRNKDALKLAGALSGGERLRAGLAFILSAKEPPQLLLLDEPTNHLDIASIEVVEEALRGYDGALIVVSHDTAFVEAIGVTREISLG